MRTESERVARWSTAIGDFDPLEPWLTESAQDESYWDDVARLVVARIGPREDETSAVAVLRARVRRGVPGRGTPVKTVCTVTTSTSACAEWQLEP